MSLSSLPLNCSTCFIMDSVFFLLLNETTKSTAQCLEFHFLLHFCSCRNWFSHHHWERSRAGAWAPSIQPQGLHTIILNKCLLFDEWSAVLLGKKQKLRKEKLILNLNSGLLTPSPMFLQIHCLDFSCSMYLQLYQPLGRWKHHNGSRDSPSPCEPGALHQDRLEGYIQENQITTMVICTFTMQPYIHYIDIFPKWKLCHCFDD